MEFTRTKVICTIGPATNKLSTLRRLYNSGMNVVRINMSHATHKSADSIIKNINKINQDPKSKYGPIGILLDTQGPEIRTGDTEDTLDLRVGDEVTLTVRDQVDVETSSIRRMKKSEFERCMENGVEEIIEVQIGYDGIVIANAVEAADLNISRKDLFLALAEMVPTDKEGELIENPYTSWKEVNSDLPDLEIEVLGPPPTSGTRDAFAELGLEGGCKTFDWIAKLKKTDKNAYKQICHTVREDGHYVEAGENDNLIVQKLNANPDALGIFGFSFLDQNADKVKGSKIESISPTFDSIADKSYSISRPLYFYVKKAHIGVVPGIKGFLREFTSERAWGEDGYLADKGMIPLPEEERFLAAKNTRSLTAMTGKEPLQ